jgi:hypothetical protein
MLNKAFNRHMEEGRLIRLVLVFALVIGAAHVAGHDQDVNGGSLDGNDQCQVCRLNHMPVASSAPPFLFAPSQLLGHVFPVEDSKYQLSHLYHTLWARAPPLF